MYKLRMVKEMDRQIAIFTGAVGAVISYLVDGIGLATTVLLGMMAIDFITGLLAAAYNKEINSRTGFKGLIRKIYYLFGLSSIYLMGYVVDEIRFAGDGAAIALCAMELVSITENGAKMNAPMPAVIKNVLAIIQDKLNGNGETK